MHVVVSIGKQNYSINVREEMVPLLEQAAELVDRGISGRLDNSILANRERALVVVALENAMRYLKGEAFAREQSALMDRVRDLTGMLDMALAEEQ